MILIICWSAEAQTSAQQTYPSPSILSMTKIDDLTLVSNQIQTTNFSLLELWLDFRKVELPDGKWQVTISVEGSGGCKIANKSALASKVSFFTIRSKSISVKIQLAREQPSLTNYLILFAQCCSYQLIPNQAKYEVNNSMFLFTVQSGMAADLPVNVPALLPSQYAVYNMLDQETFYFLRNSSNYSLTPQPVVNQFSNQALYWVTNTAFTVPYVPYVSNCEYRTNMIFPQIQTKYSPDCKFLLPNQTIPLYSLNLGSKPVADACSIDFNCVYDEMINSPNAWFVQQNNTPLFYVSQRKQEASEFSLRASPANIVPVVVVTPSNVVQGSIPQSVQLVINYYQTDPQTKIILTSFLYFDSYSENPPTSGNYRFRVSVRPMSHSEVLIAFGFKWYVYLLLYLLVGVAITLQVMIFALYHRMTNRREDKSQLKVRLYSRFLLNILIGELLGLIPTCLAMFLVKLIMTGSIFGTQIISFGCVDSSCYLSPFDYISGNYLPSVVYGRTGMAMMVVGCYFCYQTIEVGICYTEPRVLNEDRVMMGNEFAPRLWRKGHLVFMFVVIVGEILVLIFLSLSNLFSVNIWAFFASMKMIFMVIEEVHEVILSDTLPKTMLKIVQDLSNYIATLSAPDFLTYLFSFVIDLGTELFMRSYMVVIWKFTVDSIKDKLEEAHLYLLKLLEGENEDEKEAQEQAQKQLKLQETDLPEELQSFILEIDEQICGLRPCPGQWESDPLEQSLKARLREWVGERQRQNHLLIETKEEEVQQQQQVEVNDVHEIHADAMVTIFSGFVNPVAICLFWWMYNENQILQRYSISTDAVIFYFLTTVVIAVFLCPINITFIYVCEHYLGYDTRLYAEGCFDRFARRNQFWCPDGVDSTDEVEQKLCGVDKYCFSSQFFFALTIFGMGGCLVILGITTFLNNNYNPINDVYTPLVLLFWLVVSLLIDSALRALARAANLWNYKHFQSQPGQPSQPQAHQPEEQETQQEIRLGRIQDVLRLRDEQTRTARMARVLQQFYKDESFKVQFVRTNTAWVLQHLEQIFSEEQQPQVLRPLILKAIELERNKLSNYRPVHISEQSFPENRRNRFKAFQSLPRQNDVVSAVTAWQRRAKSLLRAKSYVNYYIEKSCKPVCQCCGQHQGLRAILTANVNFTYTRFLQEHDIREIKTFEHINTWQNYFAEHANLLTLCFSCSELVEFVQN